MAYGVTGLKRIQISNPEDTHGTAEAATEILFANMDMLAVDDTFHTPVQDKGTMARNAEKPFPVQKAAELEMSGELYDRMAVFLMNMAIRGNITPTQPDSGTKPNNYEWLFEPNLSSPNTPDATNGIETFTIESGDNVQGYEVPYCFITELEITGNVNEPVEFSATINGSTVSETTLTAALTAPNAKYFAFNNSNFYLDASYANLGTTAKTGMLRSFTWTLETMFTARFAADGSLSFGTVREDKKMVSLELTYYRESTNEQDERDKFVNQTLFFPRIELISNGEMDSGQSNPEYLYLDGAFRYTEYPPYEDEDGDQIITATAESFLDPTSSKSFGVTVGTTMDAFAT